MNFWCSSYYNALEWEASGVFEHDKWFLMLVLLSGLGYSIVGLAIYFNPPLQVHPMPLHMMISLVGASMFFGFFFGNNICYY